MSAEPDPAASIDTGARWMIDYIRTHGQVSRDDLADATAAEFGRHWIGEGNTIPRHLQAVFRRLQAGTIV